MCYSIILCTMSCTNILGKKIATKLLSYTYTLADQYTWCQAVGFTFWLLGMMVLRLLMTFDSSSTQIQMYLIDKRLAWSGMDDETCHNSNKTMHVGDTFGIIATAVHWTLIVMGYLPGTGSQCDRCSPREFPVWPCRSITSKQLRLCV